MNMKYIRRTCRPPSEYLSGRVPIYHWGIIFTISFAIYITILYQYDSTILNGFWTKKGTQLQNHLILASFIATPFITFIVSHFYVKYAFYFKHYTGICSVIAFFSLMAIFSLTYVAGVGAIVQWTLIILLFLMLVSFVGGMTEFIYEQNQYFQDAYRSFTAYFTFKTLSKYTETHPNLIKKSSIVCYKCGSEKSEHKYWCEAYSKIWIYTDCSECGTLLYRNDIDLTLDSNKNIDNSI